MGKAIGGHTEAPAVTTTSGSGGREPIGRYLAQQRRLRGLSLDELSAQTRIPRRSLERLEAGAFDRAPDGFARGFVRTVAEAIGLDPDETVARMLEEPTGATRRASRAGGVLVALGGLALVIALGIGLSRLDLAADTPATPATGLPTRRDFVRELAEARGLPLAPGVASATLPPEPPAPEPPAATPEPIAESVASPAPPAQRIAPPPPAPAASSPRAASVTPAAAAAAVPRATAARPQEPLSAPDGSRGAIPPIASPPAAAVVSSDAAPEEPAPELSREASGPAAATQLAPVPAPELPAGPETAAPAAAPSERAEDPD